jgi:branched-subunit amino acid permease
VTQGDLFWYGAAGSVITFVIVFVLPELMLVYQGAQRFSFDLGRAAAAVVLAALFLAIGGFLTMTLSGALTVSDAVIYGLGMETITGGTAKGLLRPG